MSMLSLMMIIMSMVSWMMIACIPGSAGEVLVLSVRDVLPRPVVPVLLGKTKVYQEELVTVPSDPHQEVVGLDVAVDEVLVVDILDPPNHLVGQHEDGLHGEPPGAEVEEVLEAWTKKVHDEHIVVPLLPVPAYVWYPYSSLEDKHGAIVFQPGLCYQLSKY